MPGVAVLVLEQQHRLQRGADVAAAEHRAGGAVQLDDDAAAVGDHHAVGQCVEDPQFAHARNVSRCDPGAALIDGARSSMPAMTDLSRWWPLPGADGLRAELERAYADPARGYHDTLHLREVLERLDAARPAGTAVVLAAWFHDSVYDGRPGDEERSAQWAERALPEAGVEGATVAEVARLVRLTEQHRPAPATTPGSCSPTPTSASSPADADRYARLRRDGPAGVRPRPRRGVRRGPGRDPPRPAGEGVAVPHDVRPRALGGAGPGQRGPAS